jgi:hypothetical protein
MNNFAVPAADTSPWSRALPDLGSLSASLPASRPPLTSRASFERLLREPPVAINGLADPAILRDSTARKLDALAADGHTGPVALVTKGCLDTAWWRERLPEWTKALDLYIFASMSGLPPSYEPAPLEPRFRTLSAARDLGASAIAYVRPIVAGVNDSRELLASLVERAAAAGCHAVVSSGFRGDPEIVASSGFDAATDDHKWMPSVKILPRASEAWLREVCGHNAVKFWTSTTCAVSALRGERHALAPYHMAPQFAGCDTCELNTTCRGEAAQRAPIEDSLDLLRYLGYRVAFYPVRSRYRSCDVEIRTSCELHCSNCTRAPEDFGVPFVHLSTWDGGVPSWGDLILARFVTGGLLCTNQGLSPREESHITLHPRFRLPNGQDGAGPLYGTTSWLMWSEYLPASECFKCSYCFVGMYGEHLPAARTGHGRDVAGAASRMRPRGHRTSQRTSSPASTLSVRAAAAQLMR